MSTVNRHGLSRTIPEIVKIKIRKESGFGCVVCGLSIFEYEHIIPEFNDAKEHNPEFMTLLCPTCHSKVTKGILSKETILKFKKEPKSLKVGYSKDWLDFHCNVNPHVKLGGSVLYDCTTILQIYGNSLFTIKPPEQKNTPFLLTASFFDTEGNTTLEIIDNEWRAFTDNWDVNVVGKRITIKNIAGDVVLCLKADPPGGIVIEYLSMLFMKRSIKITPDYFSIDTNKFYGGNFYGGKNGIIIT